MTAYGENSVALDKGHGVTVTRPLATGATHLGDRPAGVGRGVDDPGADGIVDAWFGPNT